MGEPNSHRFGLPADGTLRQARSGSAGRKKARGGERESISEEFESQVQPLLTPGVPGLLPYVNLKFRDHLFLKNKLSSLSSVTCSHLLPIMSFLAKVRQGGLAAKEP